MMLKTYTIGRPEPVRIRRFDRFDVVQRPDQDFRPGDTVYHVDRGGSGYGTVIASHGSQVTVLWSQEPAHNVQRRSGLVNQLTGQINYAMLARELVKIEKMPDPPATCYYLDPDRDAGPALT